MFAQILTSFLDICCRSHDEKCFPQCGGERQTVAAQHSERCLPVIPRYWYWFWQSFAVHCNPINRILNFSISCYILEMDHYCQDIPMKLDVKHQPLNFDIYLNNRVEIPRTSIDEEPYDFRLEIDALNRVNKILDRNKRKPEIYDERQEETSELGDQHDFQQHQQQEQQPQQDLCQQSIENLTEPVATSAAPLTPIKSNLVPDSETETSRQNGTTSQQINPREFEEVHYNPFDHLELQTIDERRELDLIFKASMKENK